MEFRHLGRSGLPVSAVGLGGSTFGETVHGDEAVAVIRHAISRGITFIDTAITYGGGRSEELIGRAIAGRRDEVVLATKVGLPAGEGPYRTGLSRRRIMAAVEQSLRRLGTDHVDLYQAHRPDPDTPVEETLAAMHDLVRDGKVRYLGASNYPAWMMARAQGICDQRNLTRWVSAQNRFNLIDGPDDPHLLNAAGELGFGVIPYQPLVSGILSGKYEARRPPPAGTRAGDLPRIRRELTASRLKAAERVRPWAIERGKTTVALAIAWLLSYPEVSTVIVGARTGEQVDQNLAGADWRLTVEERDEVRALALAES